jgi:rhodanese-related sulfurtransferase/peroxiredoxin
MKKYLFLMAMTIMMNSGCRLNAQKSNYKSVDVNEFEKSIKDVNRVQLLDVRTPEEFASGHLNNAILLNVKADSFVIKAENMLPKSKTVAVYCRSGRRSAQAAHLLGDAGYSVVNLDGGIMAWEKARKPIVVNDEAVADSNGFVVFERQPCPDFTVKLTDGKTLKMSDLRGKVVMLQFTASWCSVCRKEMPHIESEIWQRHRNDPDFVLVGIDRDEPLDKVKKFAASTGITYPLGLDPGAKIYSRFALPESGITRNVLVDRNGIIIHRTRLYNTEEFAALVKHIDKELGR